MSAPKYRPRNVSIDVTCESPAHAGSVARIVPFSRADGEWRPFMLYVSNGQLREVHHRGEPPIVYLDEDGRPTDSSHGDALRTRVKFQCPRCGDSVALRWERLEPVLTWLADREMQRVTLSQLRSAMAG